MLSSTAIGASGCDLEIDVLRLLIWTLKYIFHYKPDRLKTDNLLRLAFAVPPAAYFSLSNTNSYRVHATRITANGPDERGVQKVVCIRDVLLILTGVSSM